MFSSFKNKKVNFACATAAAREHNLRSYN